MISQSNMQELCSSVFSTQRVGQISTGYLYTSGSVSAKSQRLTGVSTHFTRTLSGVYENTVITSKYIRVNSVRDAFADRPSILCFDKVSGSNPNDKEIENQWYLLVSIIEYLSISELMLSQLRNWYIQTDNQYGLLIRLSYEHGKTVVTQTCQFLSSDFANDGYHKLFERYLTQSKI